MRKSYFGYYDIKHNNALSTSPLNISQLAVFMQGLFTSRKYLVNYFCQEL